MRRVIVTNTPDVLTDATADLTWALILACARRLVEGIDLVRSGQWTGWHPEQLLGVELRGRTLDSSGQGASGKRSVAAPSRSGFASSMPRVRRNPSSSATPGLCAWNGPTSWLRATS